MATPRLAQKEILENYEFEKEKLKPPVFIGGSGRSGTTLLLNCLGKHFNIYSIKEESNLFVPYKSLNFCSFKKYEKAKDFEKLTLSILVNIFYHVDKSTPMIREESFPEDITKIFNKIRSLNEFTKLQNTYDAFNLCTTYLTLKEKKLRWVEKTPNNIFGTEFILELYPDAKFIEIYRDPRAVCLSWLNTKFSFLKNSNILECIKIWRSKISKGQELAKQLSNQYYQLRYENLINNTEKELRKICDFIEEEFDPRMLDVEVVSNFFSDMGEEKGFSKIPLDRWKKRLTTNEKIFIDLLTKKYRKELGYPDSGSNLNIFNLFSFATFVIRKCIEGRKELTIYIKSRLRDLLQFSSQ